MEENTIAHTYDEATMPRHYPLTHRAQRTGRNQGSDILCHTFGYQNRVLRKSVVSTIDTETVTVQTLVERLTVSHRLQLSDIQYKHGSQFALI
jgi:hypothetical protein